MQRAFHEARESRRLAIVGAVRAGAPLRDVANAADCSHESVRRMVAENGAVSLELGGDEYVIDRGAAELLVYKLAGYGAGAFPRDVELLGAGDDWLPAAGDLGAAIQAAMAEEDVDRVSIDRRRATALRYVLRLTQMTIPSALSDLREALG